MDYKNITHGNCWSAICNLFHTQKGFKGNTFKTWRIYLNRVIPQSTLEYRVDKLLISFRPTSLLPAEVLQQLSCLFSVLPHRRPSELFQHNLYQVPAALIKLFY